MNFKRAAGFLEMRVSIWGLVLLTQLCVDAHAGAREEVIVVPLYTPWYYDYPYVYPGPLPPRKRPSPPPIQAEPTIPPMAPPAQPSYWYCLDAKAYYPDVTRCAGGWQQVVPRATPPPPPSR